MCKQLMSPNLCGCQSVVFTPCPVLQRLHAHEINANKLRKLAFRSEKPLTDMKECPADYNGGVGAGKICAEHYRNYCNSHGAVNTENVEFRIEPGMGLKRADHVRRAHRDGEQRSGGGGSKDHYDSSQLSSSRPFSYQTLHEVDESMGMNLHRGDGDYRLNIDSALPMGDSGVDRNPPMGGYLGASATFQKPGYAGGIANASGYSPDQIARRNDADFSLSSRERRGSVVSEVSVSNERWDNVINRHPRWK